MFRCLFVLCLVLCVSALHAQNKDSLFVMQGDHGWVLAHKVKAGETVFSLSRRYHVPPAILADINNITYQQQLTPKSSIQVPVGAYNLIKMQPEQMNESRPLYFRVDDDENLYRIARNTNVPQKTIQQWNRMSSNDIEEGQLLLVGWILYDATVTTGTTQPAVNTNTQPVPKPVVTPPATVAPPVRDRTAYPPARPVVKADTIIIYPKDTVRRIVQDTTTSEAERLFMTQTYDRQSVTEEKGPAVFYPSASKVSSGFYYAFHNTAPKGHIIRVKNTGNGKVVFVKVLGPLPQTGLYHNSIIGITSKAKAALGVMGDKAWCELEFAP